MPPIKTAVLIAPLEAAIKTLTERVDGIEKQLASLEALNKESAPKAVSPSVSAAKEEVKPFSQTDASGFRRMLDEFLNKGFDYRIEDGPNPAFLHFTVLVPKKYSNAPEAHWEIYHEDARPVVMSIREADVMLKQHLDRVFNNFSPEVRALIINDR